MAGRQLGPILLSLGLILPLAGQAAAQDVCATLYRQLTSGTERIGTTVQRRNTARALAQKDKEIRSAKQNLRSMGCSSGSVIVIGGVNHEACEGLQSSLDQMEKDRAAILSGRQPLSNRGGATRERRQRILDAIDANGCQSDVYPTLASTDPEADTDIRQPVETFIPPLDDKTHYWPSAIRPTLGFEVGAPLKSVCVRTCDGGFFPISSNASPASFQKDAETCAAMCPGTQTELFYSSLYDTESAEMISAATGEPYSQLPAANLYKSRKPGADAKCGCDLDAYYQDIMRREKIQQTPAGDGYSTIATIPSNATKPAAEETAPQTQAMEERDYDPENTHIRQVGPTFLGKGQEMLEPLKKQAGKAAP